MRFFLLLPFMRQVLARAPRIALVSVHLMFESKVDPAGNKRVRASRKDFLDFFAKTLDFRFTLVSLLMGNRAAVLGM